MFKYLRNINGTHPSTVGSFLCVAEDDACGATKAGTIFTLTNGLVTSNVNPATPLYLAFNSVKAEEEGYVRAVRLSTDTVLIADIDPESYKDEFCIGAVCGLGTDDTGKGVNVTINEDSVFEIIDVSSLSENKVTVRVI